MNDSTSNASIAALNEVLSELIDMVQEVKQARWRLQFKDALHNELENLRADLVKWAHLLLEEDEALGGSPLSSMSTSSGRTPANLWPGKASEEEIRRMLTVHLDVLAKHVALALVDQENDGVREALIAVERGLTKHRQQLSELLT